MACSAAVGAERETAVSVLRACLVSNKGGVPLSILNRDYKSLNGTPIPFKKLGYDSVEGFLRSVNDIIVKQGLSGELTVHAVPTEASAHIASLVSRQRTTRKRVPVPNICQSRKPTNQSWKPPPSSTSHMNMSRQSVANSNSPRNRLSVTVTNNGYDRPSRLVSVKMKQGGGTGAGDMRHGGYEMPPRMQRATAAAISSQEAPRNFSVESGAGGTGDSAFGAFQDVNEQRLLLDMEENLNIREKFVAEDEDEIADDVDDFENYQTSTRQRSKKSIVSPFSPRNAIAAGRAKTQAIAVKELEDKYTSTAAATRQPQPEDLQNKELFDDYNMDVAPWNRTKPGLGKINAASYMDTYVSKLKTYSEEKGWAPPEYKMIPRHPRGEGAVYGCQVKVGYDQVFSSYPDESCYPEEAREFAAKKAYNKLIEIDKTKIGNGLKVTTDLNIVHNRIFKIVERHTTGLWAETIPALYSNEYDEELPPDWLKKANTFSNLCLNYVCKGKVIVSPIQEPSLEETALQNQKLNAVSQMAAAVETIAPGPVPAIDTQVVPSDNMWDVYVTQVEPSGEIWIRIIGADYSEEYENIATEMELYYSKAKRELQSPPADLRVDGYFAAQLVDEFSSGDCWHRVRIHNINWDLKMVECSLIDNGDVDTLSFKKIYPLDRRFTYLPQQAVLCSLAGLEDYAIDEIMLDLMVKKLVGKVLVGQVKERDEDNSIYNLVLFDTQGDDDINLNEHLIECISLEGNKPQLPGEQGVQEVYVSHITDNGLLYVQIQSDMFTHLLGLIADLSLETIEEHCFKESLFQSGRCLSLDKLYLAKFNEDGNWYRATIRRSPSPIEHQVDVMFIDYGNVESVDLENICDLEPISEVLVRIPRQALPVVLHSVEVGLKECAKLKEMISDSEPVVLKMISSCGSDGTNIPAVEIFKRTSEVEGGALISINNTITLERELSRSAQRRHSVRRSKSCSRPVTPSMSRPGSPVSPAAATHVLPDIHGDTVRQNLSPPKIPNIGSDYFDIFVTMAANPSNFIVQPLSNLNSLKQLAAKMKGFYTNEADSSYLVKPDNLVEGGLYAALFENNEWYRVTLKKKISDGGQGFTCSVHKCDFGEFIGVSVENLRYLAPQFTELPYQAIKAKLAGIRPRHVDWTVEDCLRFHELVVEKQLVSVVMEKGPDLLNQTPETVLGLQIIDTSTDEDIFIATVLLNEKRAIAEVTLTVN